MVSLSVNLALVLCAALGYCGACHNEGFCSFTKETTKNWAKIIFFVALRHSTYAVLNVMKALGIFQEKFVSHTSQAFSYIYIADGALHYLFHTNKFEYDLKRKYQFWKH